MTKEKQTVVDEIIKDLTHEMAGNLFKIMQMDQSPSRRRAIIDDFSGALAQAFVMELTRRHNIKLTPQVEKALIEERTKDFLSITRRMYDELNVSIKEIVPHGETLDHFLAIINTDGTTRMKAIIDGAAFMQPGSWLTGALKPVLTSIAEAVKGPHTKKNVEMDATPIKKSQQASKEMVALKVSKATGYEDADDHELTTILRHQVDGLPLSSSIKGSIKKDIDVLEKTINEYDRLTEELQAKRRLLAAQQEKAKTLKETARSLSDKAAIKQQKVEVRAHLRSKLKAEMIKIDEERLARDNTEVRQLAQKHLTQFNKVLGSRASATFIADDDSGTLEFREFVGHQLSYQTYEKAKEFLTKVVNSSNPVLEVRNAINDRSLYALDIEDFETDFTEQQRKSVEIAATRKESLQDKLEVQQEKELEAAKKASVQVIDIQAEIPGQRSLKEKIAAVRAIPQQEETRNNVSAQKAAKAVASLLKAEKSKLTSREERARYDKVIKELEGVKTVTDRAKAIRTYTQLIRNEDLTVPVARIYQDFVAAKIASAEVRKKAEKNTTPAKEAETTTAHRKQLQAQAAALPKSQFLLDKQIKENQKAIEELETRILRMKEGRKEAVAHLRGGIAFADALATISPKHTNQIMGGAPLLVPDDGHLNLTWQAIKNNPGSVFKGLVVTEHSQQDGFYSSISVSDKHQVKSASGFMAKCGEMLSAAVNYISRKLGRVITQQKHSKVTAAKGTHVESLLSDPQPVVADSVKIVKLQNLESTLKKLNSMLSGSHGLKPFYEDDIAKQLSTLMDREYIFGKNNATALAKNTPNLPKSSREIEMSIEKEFDKARESLGDLGVAGHGVRFKETQKILSQLEKDFMAFTSPAKSASTSYFK